MDTPLGLPALPHRVARQGRPDSLRGQRSWPHSVRPGADRRWELGIRGDVPPGVRGIVESPDAGSTSDLGVNPSTRCEVMRWSRERSAREPASAA